MPSFKVEDIVHEDAKAAARAYECGVCLCLWDDPVQTPCHHIFCKECMKPVKACPLCKMDFGEKSAEQVCKPLRDANQFVLRMFHDVKVRCPNFDGTQDTGPENSNTAAAADDDDAMVKAKRRKTSSLLQENNTTDKNIDKSVSSTSGTDSSSSAIDHTCPLVSEDVIPFLPHSRPPQFCSSCEWTGSFGDLLSKHISQCPCQIVQCPLGCGEQIQRQKIDFHKQLCVAGSETCLICKERMRPSELKDHMKNKAEVHVKILQEQLRAAIWREKTTKKLYQQGNHDLDFIWLIKTSDLKPYTKPGALPEKISREFQAQNITCQKRGNSVKLDRPTFHLEIHQIQTEDYSESVSNAIGIYLKGPVSHFIIGEIGIVLDYQQNTYPVAQCSKELVFQSPAHTACLGFRAYRIPGLENSENVMIIVEIKRCIPFQDEVRVDE